MTSFEILRGSQPQLFHETAMKWRALGVALNDEADDLGRCGREVDEVWVGAAGDAAAAKLGRTAKSLDGSGEPLLLAASLLDDYATELSLRQGRLRQLLEEAERNGIAVNDRGVVVGEDPDPAHQSTLPLQVRIDATVSEATQADERYSADLAKLRPGAAPTGDQLPGYVAPAELPKKGSASPAEVARWWKSLTPQQQAYLIATQPELIGSWNGIPAKDRDEANQIVLSDTKRQLEDRKAFLLSQPDPDKYQVELADIERNLQGIEKIEDRLHRPVTDDSQQAYLLGFDTNGPGHAIVAIGNPDTADNVATFVPGTGANLHSIDVNMGIAETMANDANNRYPGQNTSVICWIGPGYDPPQKVITDATTSTWASNARDDKALSGFQEGLRATHEGAPSHNTVIAHSYGTVLAGAAATSGDGLYADDFVTIASPGTTADNVSEYHGVSKDHVWNTTASQDSIQVAQIVSPFSPDSFGTDPDRTDYWGDPTTAASQTFYSENMGANGDEVHNGYWDEGNDARDSFAAIITGNYDDVQHGAPGPGNPSAVPAPVPVP